MTALPEVHDDSTGVQICTPAFPLVIAEWDRNGREVIRVALDHYNGRHTVNVRVWYHTHTTPALQPGNAGITLSVKHLPAMADALAKALDAARELGLLVDGGER